MKRLYAGVEIGISNSNFKRMYHLNKIVENKKLYDDETFSKAVSNIQKWKTY